MKKLKQKKTQRETGKSTNKFFKISFSMGRASHYVILFFAISVLFFILLMNYSTSPIDKKNVNVLVDIPTGSSFLKVTEILNQAGLIKSRIFFYSLCVKKKAIRSIRAGEYEFNTSQTPAAMIDKLLRGEIKNYRIVIPEDLSLREIAAILDKDKLINKEDFFALAKDEDFLESLNIKAESIEGYLFPETYFFDRSMSTRQIMKIMVSQFWKKVTPGMIKRAGELKLDIHKLVTFASLIGKESGDDAEKPMISAVFHNRIKKKMRLQSDPTTVYDLEDYNGKVLRSHLRRSSPYNTYLIKGLPPGPIANPGIDSLKAVLYPASVNYLYFVSKNDGTHYFSSSLDVHNQAINRYRYINNQEIQ